MLGVKLSADQLLENERTNCTTAATLHGSVGGGASGSSRAVAAALPVWVHGRHASPHGGTDTLRTAAAAPRLTRLEAKPRLARHTLPGGCSTPCPAAHASPGVGATSTEQADRSCCDPTHTPLC